MKCKLSLWLYGTFCFAMQLGTAVAIPAIECPPDTERVFKKLPEKIREEPYYPQAKEFCRRNTDDARIMKHGPYIRWGPNGEKGLEGNYVHGQKEGLWIRRVPTQTQLSRWEEGERVSRTTEPAPDTYTIDFQNCVPHIYGIPSLLALSTYRLLGKSDENCEMRYSIDLKTGPVVSIGCLVPRTLGKLKVQNTELGLD